MRYFRVFKVIIIEIVVNHVHRSWVALVISVLLNSECYFSLKNIWEWKILELVLLNFYNLVFTNSQSSTCEKIRNLQIQSLTRQNVLLNCSWGFNLWFATRTFNIKTYNLQFHWKLQLLTHYSHFRNIRCSITHFWTIEADMISVTLDICGVSPTIGLDVLNVFWQNRT